MLRGAGCEEGGDARIVGGEVMDDVGDAVGGDEPGREGGEGCGGLLDGGERGGWTVLDRGWDKATANPSYENKAAKDI